MKHVGLNGNNGICTVGVARCHLTLCHADGRHTVETHRNRGVSEGLMLEFGGLR